MKTFRYTGSRSYYATIRVVTDGTTKLQDIILAPGDQQQLPEQHEVIKTMIATGLLVAVPGEKMIVSQKNEK